MLPCASPIQNGYQALKYQRHNSTSNRQKHLPEDTLGFQLQLCKDLEPTNRRPDLASLPHSYLDNTDIQRRQLAELLVRRLLADETHSNIDNHKSLRQMRGNKYSLLEKQARSGLYNEEELEMETGYAGSDQDTPYTQLKEEVVHHSTYAPRQSIEMTQVRPHLQTHYTPQQQMPQKPNTSALQPPAFSKSGIQQPPLPQQPLHYFPQPTVYKIPSQLKGSVMQLSSNGVVVQPRTLFIPPVNVECPFCEAKQHVPGDTDQYYCCGCKKLVDVEPKFGLFICGVCRQTVSYPYRTSDHIQCNICYLVNRVPLDPPGYQPPKSKLYQKLQQEELNQSQMLLPKELREVEPLQRAIDDDEITTIKPEKEEELEDFQK